MVGEGQQLHEDPLLVCSRHFGFREEEVEPGEDLSLVCFLHFGFLVVEEVLAEGLWGYFDSGLLEEEESGRVVGGLLPHEELLPVCFLHFCCLRLVVVEVVHEERWVH